MLFLRASTVSSLFLLTAVGRDSHSLFPVLAQWKAELNEEMSALVAFTRKEGDQDVPYICTGSVVWPEGDKPVTGRIRVFTLVATSGKDGRTELNPVASKEVEGSVYALKWVNDKLVAAVETAVRMIALYLYPLAYSSHFQSSTLRFTCMNASQIRRRHPRSPWKE